MSVTDVQLTPAEYLAAERAAEAKHECVDGELRLMAGPSLRHNLIAGLVVTLLNNALAGRPFVVCVNDLRVRIPDGPYYYPDAVVAPSPPRMEDAEQDTLLNPLVVVEVLSPSTEAIDRGEKLDNYRLIPSLSDFLIVFQDQMRVEHYSRVSAEEWRLVTRDSANNNISLMSVGVEIQLRDIYYAWLKS
ncbi:MAG: Uma2 family endonuclease [Planctomycetota bacterium]|nr:Uma2 family endonuclease [Planctomycetota bacterium]